MHSFLCTLRALVSLVAGAVLAAAAAAGQEPLFPLADVREGQSGYGLSVFSGSEPERFEVEVIGVWENVRPGTSYILARLAGQGLEESGVIAGMSGSPVYLDGRLAGAVAFAWPFSRDPIAGITPIESMREMVGVATAEAPEPAAVRPVELSDLLEPGGDPSVLTRPLEALGATVLGGASPGVQWAAAGFAEAGRRLLESGLGSVAPAGAAAEAGGELAPGSAVAAVLIDGDLRLAATGTVTDRVGDRLLAFGHPFLGLGAARFPMAAAEIVAVVPNQASSFKIGNVGAVVGAFDFDHAAGIRGLLGEVAPTTPVELRLHGETPREVRVRLARLPAIAPSLLALAVIGSLGNDAGSVGSQGIDLEADFDLGPHGNLAVRQSFDGPSAVADAAVYLFAFTGYLLQNPLEEVPIESIDVDLTPSRQPRLARLVGAHATRARVRPGERIDLHLELAAYRGEPFRRQLEIEIPTGLPDGRYSLLVGDGVSIDGARLALEKSSPVNLRQALALLGSLHSRREVGVLGVYRGRGLSVAGEVLPLLPGSIRSVWDAASSRSAVPLQLAVAEIEVVELETPVTGLVRVDLEVEHREPLVTEPGGER